VFYRFSRAARRFLFALSLAAAWTSSVAAAGVERVLFVSSYHPAFPSFDQQVAGIRLGLAEAGLGPESVMVDVEFMDTKRFPEDTQVARFRTMLAQKLAVLDRYAAVIVGDDNAFEFALAEQDRLFAGLPIVFLGVNNVARALEQNANPRMTGVVERNGGAETLRLIARLYPNADRIRVITDGTRSGQSNRRQTAEAALDAGLTVPLDFLSLDAMTYDALFVTLAALPDDAPVLLRSAFVDSAGDTLEYAEVVRNIRERFRGPLFSLQQHGLGLGILGGRMISHEEQGRAAGAMAARIMAGASPADIPVTGESPNHYFFDWREVARLGLDADDLPGDAIFIDRPAGLLETHPEWVAACTLFVLLQSAVIALLVVAVTARRRAERAQRRAAEDAELANRAKTEFLANMSHELRTPLNAVIGFSEFMTHEHGRRLSDDQRSGYLRDISDAGRHLLAMIDDILDISRIEMGRSSFEEDAIDINALLESCARLFETRARKANVRLTTVPAIDAPSLRGDTTKIRQMVINLLSNAVKFSPGGAVTLSAMRESDGGLTISVRDTGIGIDPSDIDRIVEPFNRGSRREALLREGVGLGLTIVANLARLHDARLAFDSQPGNGTLVTLRFPAGRVIGEATAASRSAA
jgi:signal transduction histidine kinase